MVVPDVKILALKVRLGVRNEAKILPCFLRCFPNVERLHIEVRSIPFTPTGNRLPCTRIYCCIIIIQL